MGLHICSACGHTESIFGEGGGESIAEEYQTTLLGSLPLDKRIREEGDKGKPIVAADPEGTITAHYRNIAKGLMAALAETSVAAPTITVED